MAERSLNIPPMLSSLSSSAAFLNIAQAGAAPEKSEVKEATPVSSTLLS
jgi:hypothetical protein